MRLSSHGQGPKNQRAYKKSQDHQACQTKSKEAAGLTKQTEPLLRQCNQANGP